MEIIAKVKNAHISPQKARLVADLIRGKKVDYAIETLSFNNKKASSIMLKVLESAIANAENNQNADIDNLMVSEISVNDGQRLKRTQPRARGRANRIIKRMSHIILTLNEVEGDN